MELAEFNITEKRDECRRGVAATCYSISLTGKYTFSDIKVDMDNKIISFYCSKLNDDILPDYVVTDLVERNYSERGHMIFKAKYLRMKSLKSNILNLRFVDHICRHNCDYTGSLKTFQDEIWWKGESKEKPFGFIRDKVQLFLCEIEKLNVIEDFVMTVNKNEVHYEGKILVDNLLDIFPI